MVPLLVRPLTFQVIALLLAEYRADLLCLRRQSSLHVLDHDAVFFRGCGKWHVLCCLCNLCDDMLASAQFTRNVCRQRSYLALLDGLVSESRQDVLGVKSLKLSYCSDDSAEMHDTTTGCAHLGFTRSKMPSTLSASSSLSRYSARHVDTLWLFRHLPLGRQRVHLNDFVAHSIAKQTRSLFIAVIILFIVSCASFAFIAGPPSSLSRRESGDSRSSADSISVR